MANRGGNVAPESPYFNRAVRLEEERQALTEDLKEVYAEADNANINVKALKRAVKLHMEPPDKKEAREETEREAHRILEALGEFVNTPLGQAASKIVDDISKIVDDIKGGEVDIQFGNEPWMSEQLAEKTS